MIYKHIPLKSPLKLSSWRKISIGSWKPLPHSSIYTLLEVNVEPMLNYLESSGLSKKGCSELQFTALVIAKVLKKHPSLNNLIRFGRVYPRKSVDIFFHVAIDKDFGEDLSGIVIRNVEDMNLSQLTSEFKTNLKHIIKTKDEKFKQIKKLFNLLPGFLAAPMLNLTSFIFYHLNIWSPLFGAPRDPFGSFQITSIGSLGIDNAFVPIAPYTRVAMVLALGTVAKRPMVIDDEVKAVKTLKICSTTDHRLVDGVHYSHMLKEIEYYFDNPHEIL